MIFFYCSSCKEELEAEDAIRGARMKCPACFKEIEVPQVGVRLQDGDRGRRKGTDRKKGEKEEAEAQDPETRFNRFVLWVMLAGVVGVLALVGVGYVLVQRAEQRRLQARPKCDACSATGKVPCAVCGGKRQLACRECMGTGKRKNVREEEEPCFACGGKGLADCTICGGRGSYGCGTCDGTGYLDGPARED